MHNVVRSYKLVKSKRKTLCLHVDSKGSLIVKAPLKLAKHKIDQFVQSKERWIRRALDQIGQSIDLSLPVHLNEYSEIYFLGKKMPICFHDKPTIHLDKVLFFPSNKRGKNEIAHLEKWLKTQAFALLSSRTQEWSNKIKAPYHSMSIGSAKKRWGSCNSKADIRYSWYLIMLPLSLIDYIIVHELVHIKQFNHSPQFWKEVVQWLPQAKELKKELQAIQIKKETAPPSPCLHD